MASDHTDRAKLDRRPGGRRMVAAAAAVMMAAAIGLGAAGAAAAEPSAALAAKAPQASALVAAAEKSGSVRVIVTLKARTTASAADTSAAADADRISSSKAAIESFLTRFFGREAAASGGTTAGVKTMRFQPMVVFEATPAQLERLARDRDVVSISEDALAKPMLNQSVPLIGMPAVWATPNGRGGRAVVAILDTGVDITHPFFAGGRIVGQACFSTNNTSGSSLDFSDSFCPNGLDSQVGSPSGDNCPFPTFSGCDHGTHVAGIAAGARASGIPNAGVAPSAAIFAVQVFARFPNRGNAVLSFSSDQISALEFLFARRDQMPGGRRLASINMSLGGGQFFSPCTDNPLRPIVQLLKNAGVATVIASGNDGFVNSTGAPGCIPEAVTVGSTDKSDVISSFSNSASFVDVLAPGSFILSSVPGGGFDTLSGTSMATPHVAGAIATLASISPSATVDQLVSRLVASGVPVADTRAGGLFTKPRIRPSGAILPPVLAVGPRSSVVINRTSKGGPKPARFTLTVRTDRATAQWRLSGVPKWLKPSIKQGTAGVTPRSVNFAVKPPKGQKKTLKATLRFQQLGVGARTVLVRVQLKAPPRRGNSAPSVVEVGDGSPSWRQSWTAAPETVAVAE